MCMKYIPSCEAKYISGPFIVHCIVQWNNHCIVHCIVHPVVHWNGCCNYQYIIQSRVQYIVHSVVQYNTHSNGSWTAIILYNVLYKLWIISVPGISIICMIKDQ